MIGDDASDRTGHFQRLARVADDDLEMRDTRVFRVAPAGRQDEAGSNDPSDMPDERRDDIMFLAHEVQFFSGTADDAATEIDADLALPDTTAFVSAVALATTIIFWA